MQARKVAIMLAITALSVITLFVLTLLDGAAFGAESGGRVVPAAVPDTLDYVREKITIGPDGDARVEVSAVLGKGGFGDLLLPFAFEGGRDFTVLAGPVRFSTDSTGLPVPTRRVLGARMLDLQVRGQAAAGDTFTVAAVVPDWYDRQGARREYGEFHLGRSYVNTSDLVFRKFDLALELPEGMLVHSVTRVVPAFDPKKSPEPPYALGRLGDRGWAVLRRDNLEPAGQCRLELNIRPSRRGPIPLVGGLMAAALYLIFFRDVLRAKETE